MANSNVGRFVWYEHLSKDPKAAIAFYTDVIGWKTQPFSGNADYTMWVSKQGPLGGSMKFPEEATKAHTAPLWMGHVQVDDVDKSTARAKELGGKVHKEPTDIPGVGRFAVIADRQGATFSIFQPKDAMKLHDETKEGEFCWSELITNDPDDALEFYSGLFGWDKMKEVDMGTSGTYVIFGLGGKQLGGVMKQPKGMPTPPTWVYFTETKNLEAAVGRASGKGATVTVEPMQVPGGRVAELMDPQGALFALHEAA
jgi:predicted enzyme related to lactoylglutathione lyase